MAEESENDSGEKSEEPSAYRIEESRKKGDVASSKELNSVLILAGMLLTALLASVWIYELFTEYLHWILTQDNRKIFEAKAFVELIQVTAWFTFKATGPLFLVSLAIGFFSQFAQIGFLWSPEIINANFERINPLKGFQRLFSKKALVEAIKGVFKFILVLAITWSVAKKQLPAFFQFLHMDVESSFIVGKSLIIQLGFSLLLGLGIVALADFAWEKWSYRQKMMMTKQELKQETKERDGNPEIKQKIRQIQRQMAQKRMIADVKKADVIITNPTHISVALRYDTNQMVAPEVIAKGADHLALQIREVAKESQIPIVENVLLARTLYSTVKVGQGVPRTLYRAVAEVIAFVYKLKKKQKALDSFESRAQE
jgi:flagellar biosynthetic protein FlhB